ncbi:MAG TPA: hypothetical protein VLT62_07505 [Candidatus Methylomirabilis sp.]|nr:hypothetical protein [Candidatus Methylomirabilis sp.]
MDIQTQRERVPLSRIVLGLGFFLLFLAVGVGAAMKGQSAIPKFIGLAAVVAIVVGAIGAALQGRTWRRV